MSTPTEERIERLESRVDRLEDRIATDIAKIFTKLDDLAQAVSDGAVAAAGGRCPSPGACLTLGKELQHVVAAHDATMLRVERFELKLIDSERAAMQESRKIDTEFAKLEKQKAWVLGAWSAIAFFASIIGAALTVLISHFLNKL